MHKLMMQCSYFYLSTISSLMHDMIYSLICSRTSKCLSLGELIRAFYIINIVTYMFSFYWYMPSYIVIYAFLVDFRDFPTKSPSLVFNSCEAENLLFCFLLFQGPSGHLKIEEKIPDQFFTRRSTVGQKITREEPRGGKEARWRALPSWACHPCPFHPRASSWVPFLTEASVSPKNLSHIFPEIYWGGGGGESPLLLRERADPVAPVPPVKGKSTSSSSPLLLGLGGCISINISISTIITTITIFEIDFISLIVCVELNLGYCFEASCMFVIGTLSLFGGEIIYSDCVVTIMPLVHIMFDTCE